MDKHFLIDITNGGPLFQLFYVLAFLSAYVILIYEGYKRKFPLTLWVIMLTAIFLAFVIGTKIFSFTWEEWRYMFQKHFFLPNHEKSLIGGVILGMGAYLITRNLSKFKYAVWDTFAIAFPIGISIQSLGCFFYGCCFGKISYLPWAVKYPVMSLAHYTQFEEGQLTFNDLYSLPVHPVQLYLSVGGLLATFLVIRFRKYWKADGSLLLSSVILLILTKFVIEFFTDPAANHFGGKLFLILKQIQWLDLSLAITLIFVLIRRENFFNLKPAIPSFSIGLKAKIVFLFSLVLIFLILHNWFTFTEAIAINVSLLPALFFIGIEIFKTFASLKVKWVYICCLFLPLFLMSQTLPHPQTDTIKIKKYNIFHTIGGGYSTGNYSDDITYYSGSGCNTISNTQYFSQKYSAGGLGYILTKESADHKELIRYGANIFMGNYRVLSQSDEQEESEFIFGINPYIKYDIRWFGVGGGLLFGNMIYTTGDRRKEGTPVHETGFIKTPIFPQFYLRFGPKDIIYADFHIADQFSLSSPGLAFQTGLGTGFGLTNGLNLRLGFTFLDKGGYYISGYFPIHDKIILEPLFAWSRHGSLYPVDLPEDQFSIGLSYRFGYK